MFILLLAAKTSEVGHLVGEKIEYFYETATDLVSANLIPLVHRLSFLRCAPALPNSGSSKNLETAAWMLKERGCDGSSVSRVQFPSKEISFRSTRKNHRC